MVSALFRRDRRGARHDIVVTVVASGLWSADCNKRILFALPQLPLSRPIETSPELGRSFAMKIFTFCVLPLVFLELGCQGASPQPAQSARSSEQPASENDGRQVQGDRSPSSSLPDFELETLSGGSARLSDYVGKQVVLIDFWATYCDPCLVAMPHLDALYRDYKDRGLVVLGVSVDGPQSVARVRTEVRQLGVSFPILLDPETEALSLYNPKTSAPYSVLIDRSGKIIKRKEGFVPTDVPALRKEIEAAL